MSPTLPAHASGTFTIGERTVHRLGFGTMRLTGPGIWGEPVDRAECVAVVRRAVELGVDLIDTADSYGPAVSEDIIREALHPYPSHVLIASKAGLVRTGPDAWFPVARPRYLRQQAEMSLRRLRLDCIPLFQLHRIDEQVPLADSLGALVELRDEGKIEAIGLSEVGMPEIEEARAITPIATVQNLYNLTHRRSEPVVEYCAANGIGFIPWYPIGGGRLAAAERRLDDLLRAAGGTPAQVALAWLLARSEVILPIPGTSQISHLEENLGAAEITLTDDQVAGLTAAGTPHRSRHPV
jgi:aryl-alcohol dehydrogenase-like predicted oxidoreductase